jgi:4-hydroxy-tetrahydrodipicolinate synthase
MTDRLPIAGIYTPNLVPLTHKGDINEKELRRYIDWLIAKGVHGLYPNGSTGEFIRFSEEERRTLMRIVVDQVAGRVPILAGAAEANARETIKACEYYHELGVRAVAIVSPIYYRLGAESLYEYFREIASQSPIDVTLYNIPMFASPIDIPTIQKLAIDCPRIIGIKDSSGDVPHMMRMVSTIRPIRPDFSFLTGWEPVLVPMLMAGCHGGTHATSGVVPEITSAIYRLAQSGQWNEAFALQRKIVQIFDPMLKCEFPNGFRVAACLRGFDFHQTTYRLGATQQALMNETSQQIQMLLEQWKL